MSRQLFDLWCEDSRNGAIFTGYSVPETLAYVRFFLFFYFFISLLLFFSFSNPVHLILPSYLPFTVVTDLCTAGVLLIVSFLFFLFLFSVDLSDVE